MSKYMIRHDPGALHQLQGLRGALPGEKPNGSRGETRAADHDGPGEDRGEDPDHFGLPALLPLRKALVRGRLPDRCAVKREKDGMVLLDRALCVGCRACVDACPWKVPQWDETTGKVVKCDSCVDRVEQGLKPACVAGCTTRALSFSRPNERVREARHRYAKSCLVKGEKDTQEIS